MKERSAYLPDVLDLTSNSADAAFVLTKHLCWLTEYQQPGLTLPAVPVILGSQEALTTG